jgi:F-type H+-transporting ATPase subunit gamma
MSDSSESLRRKIDGAADLQSVVRTMKALAASSISQYENAVVSLQDYYRTVELGLVACLRQTEMLNMMEQPAKSNSSAIGVIVFGSDQGLVGQFNDVLADFVTHTLSQQPQNNYVWAVGERMHLRLEDAGLHPVSLFSVPHSVNTISTLIARILLETESYRQRGEIDQLYLFHNRPKMGNSSYQPISQRMLPLDAAWQQNLQSLPWPTNNLPEVVLLSNNQTLKALIREYLFVSLYRVCAESLASENTSRLIAMQRAEKNIKQQLEDWQHTYHRLRQNSIDAELFDLVSGFEALNQ